MARDVLNFGGRLHEAVWVTLCLGGLRMLLMGCCVGVLPGSSG